MSLWRARGARGMQQQLSHSLTAHEFALAGAGRGLHLHA